MDDLLNLKSFLSFRRSSYLGFPGPTSWQLAELQLMAHDALEPFVSGAVNNELCCVAFDLESCHVTSLFRYRYNWWLLLPPFRLRLLPAHLLRVS